MKYNKNKSIFIVSLGLLLFCLAGCESARFENAYRKDTIEGYNEFKRQYPGNEHSSTVDERIRELEEENLYFESKKRRTRDTFRLFLQRYPEGKYANEIRDRLVISEVTLTAKSHELPLVGSGGKDIVIIVKNKTGLDIKMYGMSMLLFEADIQADETKRIPSKGYTIIVCKDIAGRIIPESYTIFPEKDEVIIEIWLSDSKGSGKIISFFEQD